MSKNPEIDFENRFLDKTGTVLGETAFFKRYDPYQWKWISGIFPQLGDLSERGHAPEIFATRKLPYGTILLMENIKGTDLRYPENLPPDLRFSPELFRAMAELSYSMFKTKLFHNDFFGRNVMYNPDKGKCMVVDLDAFSLNSQSVREEEYVKQFSDIMYSIYLGSKAYYNIPRYNYFAGNSYQSRKQYLDFHTSRDFVTTPMADLILRGNQQNNVVNFSDLSSVL